VRATRIAGFFVGGMEGIIEEWDLFDQLLPDRPRIPLAAPGGAAAGLVERAGGLPEKLAGMLDSRRYPVLAHEMVGFLARL
jgi:hypothetical protein